MPRKTVASSQFAKQVSPVKKPSATPKAKLRPEIIGQEGSVVPLSEVEGMIARAVQSAMPMKFGDDQKLSSSVEAQMKLQTNGTSAKDKAPASVVSEALSHLNTAVSEAHTIISSLIAELEPHLPRHLFDDKADSGEVCMTPTRVPNYSTTVSSTVNTVNSATNEVDRLVERVQWLRNNIVI